MYSFGFFYFFHFPIHNKNAILLMVDGILLYKEFNDELISNVSYIRRNNSHNVHFQPLLCRLDNNRISDIIFLDDLMSSDKGKNNFLIDINKKDHSAVLLYYNEPFIDNCITNEKERLFGNNLVELAACKKMVSYFEQKISFISPRRTSEYQDYDMRRITKDLMKIVESYDIQRIVSSMNVVVEDGHRSKIGDDDHYWIIRTAYIEDKSISTDGYIDEVLGIGRKEIYSTRGYASWESLKATAPKVFIGVYSGKTLEDERTKVLSNYSKEEHLAYLIFSKLNDKANATNEIEKWNTKINHIYDNLNTDFMLDKISHLDSRYFEGYNVKMSDLLIGLNNLIRRIQFKMPIFKIVVSGAFSQKEFIMSDLDSEHCKKEIYKEFYTKQITEEIEELLQNYNVVIISGNAQGAENFSLKYAIDNKLVFICDSNNWTSLGREGKMDRYYEMTKMADLILLTPFSDSHLYVNFKKAAKELGVPLKIIDEMNII